jgi:predicted component of type VI protein secretion system
MKERMNEQVVQTRRETDRQGQEIIAASSSLLASIQEHKEQIGVTIDILCQDITKSKAHVNSKFRSVSGEVQDIRQHSAAETSRLSVTLGDLQAKLLTGKADHSSPAVPVNALSGQSGAAGSVISRAGYNNAVPSIHGLNCVNGCSTSVCNDVTNQSNSQPIHLAMEM